ncbi:hypothetical protein HELRODRAFT_112468, partial [Helobdella robusta]|uniref:Uncharacterized protein n=1 Tax=Helobdella robusta TaxID=6412 RepID=T1EFK1_HELRO
MSNFQIFIGSTNNTSPREDATNKLCSDYPLSNPPIPPATNVTILCFPTSISGRFVTFWRSSGGFRPDALSICEIFVIAEKHSGSGNQIGTTTTSSSTTTTITATSTSTTTFSNNSTTKQFPPTTFSFVIPTTSTSTSTTPTTTTTSTTSTTTTTTLTKFTYSSSSLNFSTTPNSAPNCPSDKFQCSNGDCIDSSWRCDKQLDCEDSSDEVDCACTNGEMKCVPTGLCVPREKICDGIKSCPDNSDEVNCKCQPTQYKCLDDGTCIHNDWLCDGIRDCAKGDDEDGVRCSACSANKFTCKNRRNCLS